MVILDSAIQSTQPSLFSNCVIGKPFNNDRGWIISLGFQNIIPHSHNVYEQIHTDMRLKYIQGIANGTLPEGII